MMEVRSPYVVRCREFVERKNDVVIIMDYCDGGTLGKFVLEHPTFFAEH